MPEENDNVIEITEEDGTKMLCELYDIESKKYMPQGTIAQAWSVAEVFRIIL